MKNKFGDLDKTVDENIDVLCIGEKKMNLFPIISFLYQYNQSIYTGYHRQQKWFDGIC